MDSETSSFVGAPIDSLHSRAKSSIDYDLLAQEMISYLRGPITQRSLSDLLGYTFNQVGKWESGATKIKWSDFVQLCSTLEVPLRLSTAQFFGKPPSHIHLERLADTLLDSYGLIDLNNTTIRTKLNKWRLGKIQIHLSDVLAILDTYPSSLFAWLMAFVDGEQLRSIQGRYHHFLKTMQAVSDNPTYIYVNTALKVKEYVDLTDHSDEILGKHALMPVKSLRRALQELTSLGLVLFDGRKFLPCPFDFSFSNLRHQNLRRFNKYSTLLAGHGYPLSLGPLQRYESLNASRSSVRVNALSKEAADKINDLIMHFHNRATEVIQNDIGPKNNVQIIVLHSFASTLIDPDLAEGVLDSYSNDKLLPK